MQKELFEAMDIEIVHTVVSGGVVYKASRDTNYNYVSGTSETLTPEQMVNLVIEDRKALEEEGIYELHEYFDEFYEATYQGQTKKWSVIEYIYLAEMLEVLNRNMINVVFMH
nr:hypothetical protein [uncultured Butyrivibrio sp.]